MICRASLFNRLSKKWPHKPLSKRKVAVIPKKIHYAWFSEEPKPESVLQCIESWRKYAPDFEICEWDAKRFPWEQYKWTAQAFETKKWAFATDLFRVWVLSKYGGVYLDSDVEMMSPLSDLLGRNRAVIGLETKGRIGPHFMAAEPAHPYIGKLLSWYLTQEFVNDKGIMNATPMPVHATIAFRSAYGSSPIAGEYCDIEVAAENCATIDARDGRAVLLHRLAGSWVKEEERVNAMYFFQRRYHWDEFLASYLSIPRRRHSCTFWDWIRRCCIYSVFMGMPAGVAILYLWKTRHRLRMMEPF